MLRVVQWATGAVGRHALAAMIDHPELDVVGVLVYSDDKAGRDAGEGAAPDWPRGRGWKVAVEGSPSMVLEAQIATHGEDENDQGCLGTATHAVHAIEPVCAAPPGIRTFLDLPTIVGRHVLRRG